MNTAVRALYESLTTLFKNSKTTLKNVVVILLVFGLEQIFEKGVFNCPASDIHCSYGLLFIFGPAVCLFNLTLLLHNHFWEVVTGCRQAHFSRRWVCKNVAKVALQAILPAGVWIVTALVQGHYYVCAKLGPKEEALRMAESSAAAKEEIEKEYTKAAAESQILAWALFDSLVIIGTLAVCVRRCCFLRAEGSMPTIYDYEKIEAEAAVVKFQERMEEEAKQEAERHVNNIFEEFQHRDGYTRIVLVHKKLTKKYPRCTGNLSKPYRQAGVVGDHADSSNNKTHAVTTFQNGRPEEIMLDKVSLGKKHMKD